MPEYTFRTILQATVTFVAYAATEASLRLADGANATGACLEAKVDLVETASPQFRVKRFNLLAGPVLEAVELDDVGICDVFFGSGEQVFTAQGAVYVLRCPDTATNRGRYRTLVGGKVATEDNRRPTETQ